MWLDVVLFSTGKVRWAPSLTERGFRELLHFRAIFCGPFQVFLPVRAERREREHRHTDRCQLDDGDEFARRLPEHPLLGEEAEGVHGHAGDQQQQVSRRQAGDEDVGHAAHGAVGDEDLHERDVAQQTHGDDEDVQRGHDAAHDEVDRFPAVRGRPPSGLLGGVGGQSLGISIKIRR